MDNIIYIYGILATVQVIAMIMLSRAISAVSKYHAEVMVLYETYFRMKAETFAKTLKEPNVTGSLAEADTSANGKYGRRKPGRSKKNVG